MSETARVRSAILKAPRTPVTVEDVELPPPGAGQVQLRMEACGVCHSDLMIASLEALPVLPLVVGHEGVGRVEAVGEGVSGIRVGDRVGVTYLATTCGKCDLCTRGLERYCPKQTHHGYTQSGAMAQRVNVMAQHLARVPEALAPELAAPMCCAGWTAYGAVRGAGLRPGQSLGIFGLGGLGHLAVQYARHLGLEVAAADLGAAKLEHATSLGAKLAVEAAGSGRAITRAMGGVDAAVVFTGAVPAVAEAFKAVKRGGTVYLVGMNAGAHYELPLNETILKGIAVRGSYLGTREDLEAVFRLAVEGVGIPHVETHAIDEVPRLFERLERGEVLGRAVVRFATAS